LYIWQLGLGGLSGHDALTSSATYHRVHLCCTSYFNPPLLGTTGTASQDEYQSIHAKNMTT